MNLSKAQELVKKLYHDMNEGRTPRPEEVNQLWDFMKGTREYVVIAGEYEVRYNPETEMLEVSYHPQKEQYSFRDL